MIKEIALRERTQSLGEEIANSVSHGIALLAAVAGAPVLVLSAVQHDGAAQIVGASVFAATMVLLYLTSTLYHAMPRNRAKRVFQVLDHAAIFLYLAMGWLILIAVKPLRNVSRKMRHSWSEFNV